MTSYAEAIRLGFWNSEHYVLRCLLHSGRLITRVGAL